MHRLNFWVLVFAAPLIACNGMASGSLNTANADRPPPGHDPDGNGTTVVPATCEPHVAPTLIRRLVPDEYNRTVAALLGDTSRPADAFPPEAGTGFDNEAGSQSLSPTLVADYEAAAQAMMDAVWSDPARHATLTACPGRTPGSDGCALAALSRLASRAWRRPVQEQELTPLLEILRLAASQGDGFDVGLRHAFEAVLLSPRFLFLTEPVANPTDDGSQPVDAFTLASRLSYFLWRSMPDEPLFAAAGTGTLHSDAEIAAQVRRMLADPRADALVDAFGAQWLRIGLLQTAAPSPEAFPEFDESLRASMLAERRAFLQHVFTQPRPLTDLVTSDQTFVDQRLAAHYGLADVSGEGLHQVSLAGTQRRGLLGQAAFLTAKSTPTRTSVAKRGEFILGQLLCAAPPPPPPEVNPSLEMTDDTLPLKERLAQHRSDPACAGCHVAMDPIGLTLEGFDPVGRSRTHDGALPVDDAADIPGVGRVQGGAQLAEVVARDPRFTRCVTRHVLSYALARALTAEDDCTVEQIAAQLPARGGTFEALLVLVAQSEPFRQRRAPGVQP